MHSRRGVTLIELLVTLVVLAAITSVTALGVRQIQQPPVDDPTTTVAESLEVAIRESRVITLELAVRGSRAAATVYPDGSAIVDTAIHVDRFTGRRTDAR